MEAQENGTSDSPPADQSFTALFIMNGELVKQLVDEIVREEAWWIGAQTGNYVVRTTVWADGNAAITMDSGFAHFQRIFKSS